MSRIIKHPNKEYEWSYYDTKNNMTMPWYTIGALEWLITLPLNNMSVFEYGCGRSSLWWQKECKYWNGVDDDSNWANGGIVTTDKKQYLEASLNKKYDIIVIDGIYRDECTEYALKSINNNGFIVYDNWEQKTTDTFGDFWINTQKILNLNNILIFKEPEHIDWKTAIYKILQGNDR